MANSIKSETDNTSTSVSTGVKTVKVHVGLFQRTVDQMRVVGYPGPIFPAIHICALICITVSVTVSVSLIIYRCCSCRNRQKSCCKTFEVPTMRISVVPEVTTVKAELGVESRLQNFRKFDQWSISERLVIYLAIADTFVGLAHIPDHAYYLYAKTNPPDLVCATFALILQTFAIAQWIIVLFTAVRASSLVVFDKKLSSGRKDWKLISAALGVPAIGGAVVYALGMLGQNGERYSSTFC